MIVGGAIVSAQPTNIQVKSSNTQALITYKAPDALACTHAVTGVNDVNTTMFPGSNSDDPTVRTSGSPPIKLGTQRTFVLGTRQIQGDASGKYRSRALEANTAYSDVITCSGGSATVAFSTTDVPFGNTFAEPFVGYSNPAGTIPYPYLDPSVRGAFYIDPQTGLRHTRVTFASDHYDHYDGFLPATYSDATDMDGATWSNPTNVYETNMATTATTGTGNLWIGVRNTQLSNTYDSTGRGPSYDEFVAPDSTGSFNYYQVSIDAQVSSGSDSFDWCLSVDRVTCATALTTQAVTSSLTTYLLGSFSATPDGSNGGNGADPVLYNASPQINRWRAYTHMGTVTADGAGNLAWVSGNYFVTEWGSSSFLRLSLVSAADACLNGTSHAISSVTSGVALITADMPAANTYFYCANNFGILVKRTTPDARTFTLENAKFNISYSGGPSWFSTADQTPQSYVKFNGGYYMVIPPGGGGTDLLYFFDTSTGASTFIGPTKPNSNLAGADQWFFFQIPGNEGSPFDNTLSTSTGHLVWYNSGPDVNGKQVIIKTELSGPPSYQGNTSNALMDETGAMITHPDAFSVRVVNHGMTATFTNITPASQGKDLTTQMALVPGFNSAFMTVSYSGVANGKLYLQGRGNQNTISVFARLDPATGLIDNFTNTWTQTNCRWCINHSGLQPQGDVNFVLFGTDTVGTTGINIDGGGPWITQTNTAVSASPSVTCPANSIGAPTTGTACDTFALNSHGGANPFEPYDPDPGPDETDFLQTAQPGDTFCVTATSTCNFTNEILVYVTRSTSTVTMWRPCSLSAAACVAIAGAGLKTFFAWCTGVGTGLDSNGMFDGSNQGEPTWDSTTSGASAVWYRDLYFLGGHADAKYHFTVNGTSISGQLVEVGQEKVFCGIPGVDALYECYRVRLGTPPSILSTAPTFTSSQGSFADVSGIAASGSHLSVGGLVSSTTDDRPFLGDGLGCTWSLQGGTTHVYQAATCTPLTLNRKFLQTAAVAGPHVLKDISSASTGNVLTDATDFSYCVANASNECRTGASTGDVFVSASQRTFLGCYGGQSLIDIFAPGGNVQEDICVFPASPNTNSLLQTSLNPDPIGWQQGRVLSTQISHNKMSDSFANDRVLQDSSWAVHNERWGTSFRNEVMAVKMPALGSTTDTINRGAFVPVEESEQAVNGADGIVVDFGYSEYGSDGASKFYCTSRQENCVANQGSAVNFGSTPFYFAGESFSPLTCASGTCNVVIPSIPGRVLYYRVRRTLSGSTVFTGQVKAVVLR